MVPCFILIVIQGLHFFTQAREDNQFLLPV